MPQFTIVKKYPDGSRHVAHLPHDEVDQYKSTIDLRDADDGFDGGYWLTFPLEAAQRRV